jgi:K+-sensing histidine kinase KdpD
MHRSAGARKYLELILSQIINEWVFMAENSQDEELIREQELVNTLAGKLQSCEQRCQDLEEHIKGTSFDLRSSVVTLAGFLGILQRRHGTQLGENGRTLVEQCIAAAQQFDNIILNLLSILQPEGETQSPSAS